MEDLILLDTTELLRVMPRKLHAAWAELSGTGVAVATAGHEAGDRETRRRRAA